MNLTAVIALTTGLLIVFAAQLFEGGSISVLFQPAAFLIVIGGTICAALLNFSFSTVKHAFICAKKIFDKRENRAIRIIEDITRLANYARHNGILALQGMLGQVEDHFLVRGIQLAVDLNNPQFLYDVLSAEIAYEEEEDLISSRVFEALGGYAPTFGVVGAVLGLIQVMSHLQNIYMLGSGIATAFVSTLYGVGFANFVLLPIAGNLKQKTREKIMLKEVVLQGIMSILMQENPAIIEEKLISYMKFHDRANVRI